MKRLLSCFALLAPLAASPAFADSLYNLTLTGDGHTFQFSVPNPPTTTDNPHLVYAQLPAATGMVDGVGGYSFSGNLVVLGNSTFFPVLYLSVSPDPSGIQPPYFSGADTFLLNGQTFTTLVSDVPNPMPNCNLGVCNDLLSFAFVPGEYSLYGYDPDHIQGSYTLDIAAATPATASTVTGEPSSLLFMVTGLAGTGVTALRQRRLAVAGPLADRERHPSA